MPVYFHDTSGTERTTWGKLVATAEEVAAGLRRAGVRSGATVPVVLTNRHESAAGLVGAWFAGARVASLPLMARGMSLPTYVNQLSTICEQLQAETIVVDDNIAASLEAIDFGVKTRTWSSMRRSQRFAPEPPELGSVAFVQYSSGTTSAPRGCMLTTSAIESQMDILADALEADAAGDKGAVWLPLSHDMGLFGCLLFPWVIGFPLSMSTPERFLGAPQTWFDDCASFGATITVGPDSALRLAARAARVSPPRERLKLKTCIIGAERVYWTTLTSITEALGGHGLSKRVLMPAYGLAEATLAVTAVGLNEEPRVLRVNEPALQRGRLKNARGGTHHFAVVSVGRPLKDVEVSIERGRAVGEICVQSPSLMEGYLANDGASVNRMSDQGLRTGDQGFIKDGELFVCGRLDDILSIGGRKVHASELEALITQQPGIRKGCCVVIELDNTDGEKGLVLIAEPASDSADLRQFGSSASSQVYARIGLPLKECIFIERNTLPKTPSGKPQRFRCRELLLSGELAVLDRVLPQADRRSPT